MFAYDIENNTERVDPSLVSKTEYAKTRDLVSNHQFVRETMAAYGTKNRTKKIEPSLVSETG